MAKTQILKLRRGTTPIITARVIDDIDLSPIKTAWLTIEQGGKIVLDKVTSDLHINEHNIALYLTQEDTLALIAGIAGSIQLRLLQDDNPDIAYASQQAFVAVDGVIKDGVIV